MRKVLALGLAVAMLNPAILGAMPQSAEHFQTTTPIKHLVIIFQENVSFDHYFATYPNATNPAGEPTFHAKEGTPSVNGLLGGGLLTNNPNFLNAANAPGNLNPFRFDRSQAATTDQDHTYKDEQKAFHAGLMDLFPVSVGTAGPPPAGDTTKGVVMGYFDGNTVTALWNYAQHFALSDNSFDTTFGPSTPGALNVISGQTNGLTVHNASADSFATDPDGNGSFSIVDDSDPFGDVCSGSALVQMAGKNIGDLLSAANITWGFFEGGFDLTITNTDGSTGCKRTTTSAVTNVKKVDYIAHHEPFQYYASTANPTHKRPTAVSMIGQNGDAGNHQYDIHDFFDAVSAGNWPAVSYLKAPGFQDGHSGYSDPLDEQTFLVNTINFLQKQEDWDNTAVIIAYDDSDGWYDHVMGPIVNQSTSSFDQLTGAGNCGNGTTTALPGPLSSGKPVQGRCGYGPRMPLLVISPFAKSNFVDHSVTDLSSIVKFIEDNWLDSERITGSFDAIAGSLNNMFDFGWDRDGGDRDREHNRRLFLNPTTGQPFDRDDHD
ncbi:MAG TPA: alkaline phosphatase family protein [Candidatus Acidoferrales bacterium]|nr:alkaline phosphatase family protein [Candidatus Acidoferrales bacterium]